MGSAQCGQFEYYVSNLDKVKSWGFRFMQSQKGRGGCIYNRVCSGSASNFYLWCNSFNGF